MSIKITRPSNWGKDYYMDSKGYPYKLVDGKYIALALINPNDTDKVNSFRQLKIE